MELVKKVGAIDRSVIKYVVIGGSTVAIDMLLLIFLHSMLGINVLIAATVSYWSSLAFNFLCNKLWTFGVKANTPHHLALYACLIVVNYFTGLAFIATLTSVHISYLIAKLGSLALTTTWNYFLYKNVIFISKEKQRAGFNRIKQALPFPQTTKETL